MFRGHQGHHLVRNCIKGLQVRKVENHCLRHFLPALHLFSVPGQGRVRLQAPKLSVSTLGFSIGGQGQSERTLSKVARGCCLCFLMVAVRLVVNRRRMCRVQWPWWLLLRCSKASPWLDFLSQHLLYGLREMATPLQDL